MFFLYLQMVLKSGLVLVRVYMGRGLVPWQIVKETIPLFPVTADMILEYPESDGRLKPSFLLEMAFEGIELLMALLIIL